MGRKHRRRSTGAHQRVPATTPRKRDTSTDEVAARIAEFLRNQELGVRSERLLNPYQQSVGVYRCVGVIASNLARAPLEVYAGDRKVEKHPLVDLLKRPNPAMPTARFVHTVASHALLHPNAYVLIDAPDINSPPRYLLPLPPDRTSPLRPRHNPYDLLGWRFRGFETVDLHPREVARFEYAPDPDDPYMGVPPIMAARLAADTDHLSAILNKAIIQNDGRPAGILKYTGEDDLSDDEVEEIRNRWKETHGGPANAEKVAILLGKLEWQPTTIPPRDMQYLAGRKWNLGDIARAFNVPPVFLGEYEASGLSDAGMKFFWRMLYQSVIQPFAEVIQQVLTESVASRYGDDLTIVFNWDNVEALRDDIRDKIEIAKGLQELHYTQNQIADFCDLPEVDNAWGDTAFIPAGMLPAEVAMDLATLPDDEPAEEPSDEPFSEPAPDEKPVPDEEPAPAGDQGASEQADPFASEPGRARTFKLSPARMAMWRRHLRVAQPYETRILARLRKNLLKQRKRVLDALDDEAPNVPVNVAVDLSDRELNDFVELRDETECETRGAFFYRVAERIRRAPAARVRKNPNLARIVAFARAAHEAADAFDPEDFARSIEDQLKQAYRVGSEDLTEQLLDLGIANDDAIKTYMKSLPQLAELYYDSRIDELVHVGDRIRERVRDAILEGLMLGETLAEIKDRVKAEFNASNHRARNIARTEAHNAVNGGKYETLLHQNPHGENEWLTAGDSEVRQSHRIDGERRRTGEEFSNGLLFPGDPRAPAKEVCNCRCTIVPVSEIDAELAIAA